MSVDRRDFLKSSGVALASLAVTPLAAPAIPANEAAAAICWADFCDPADCRWDFSRPWIRRGYKFASDAAMMVRQPVDEPDSIDRIVPGEIPQSSQELVPWMVSGRKLRLDRVPFRPFPYGDRPSFGWSDCENCSDDDLSSEKTCDVCRGAQRGKDGRLWLPHFQRLGHKLIFRDQFEKLSRLPGPLEFFDLEETCGIVIFRGPSFEAVMKTICSIATCGPSYAMHFYHQPAKSLEAFGIRIEDQDD